MKRYLLKTDTFCLLSLLLLLMAFALGHEYLNTALRYDRGDLVAGQWWRLITAHIVHVNINHALLNCAGLAIGMLIVGALFSWRQWALSMLFMTLFISAFLFWFSPQVVWYVGFSGVLHGILVLGFLTFIIRGDFVFVLAFIILLGKVIREQMPSFDTLHLHGIIAAPVVVDAHLYGVFAGILCALFFLVKEKRLQHLLAKAGVR
ncbi:hypothetical protein TDB9533_03977 [Thalassocella blandensis]|nr:hypothetical protein TDB9533_03977 [Thalassocella blandensis]